MTKNITNPMELPITLQVEDLMPIMRIGRVKAYELVRREDFPKFHIGKRIVIPRDAFLKWLNSSANQTLGA